MHRRAGLRIGTAAMDQDKEDTPLYARILRYAAMAGATALVFASGMASGMLVDGTSETLQAYRTQIAAPARVAVSRTPVQVSYRQQPVTAASTPSPMQAAWFPEHNSVRWDVSLAPGQDMSGLSVRNAHTDRNLVVVLNAVGSDGQWIRAGLINVAAGREAVVHPPTGSYAMTVLQLPLTMAYTDLERAETSRTVYFDLTDAETAASIPVTRFQVSDGQASRLPDLTTYAARPPLDSEDA